VPRHCPQCGNSDLSPEGRGTQKLVEELAERFPQARIARIDRDSAASGRLPAMLQQIHQAEVDLVVGTQMLAKGHDWGRLQTVVVLEADSGLFAADFRASERLFANLIQVAGRAGRANPEGATVLIQTLHPDHPLFKDLRRQDFDAHAAKLLAERSRIGLPPFRYQALVRAQAKQQSAAEQFMRGVKGLVEAWMREHCDEDLRCYDPVPMLISRVDHWHRLQLLLDAGQRRSLHKALQALRLSLSRPETGASKLRWQIDIDPQEI